MYADNTLNETYTHAYTHQNYGKTTVAAEVCILLNRLRCKDNLNEMSLFCQLDMDDKLE